MRVAVIGGTGGLGSLAVAELSASGDVVRAVSRTAPPDATLPHGVQHAKADLASGDGLRAALDGIEAVLDASNDRKRAKDVLVEGTRRLTAAAADAGVAHLVGVSIVGCDRVPNPYYDAKVAQERALAEGALPWSLLRATQFHALVAWAFESAARRRVVPTGAAKLQPVDTAVVARRLAELVHDEPAGRVPDLGGPQLETLSQLARAWRAHHDGALVPLRIPSLGKGLRAMRDGGLTDLAAAAPGPMFGQWLAAGGRGKASG